MKKKSIKLAAKQFEAEILSVHQFLAAAKEAQFSETHVSLCYEYAIIRLYREFEKFMLHAVVACLNHDSSHFSERTTVKFPKHLTQDVCQFLLTKGGYFDFKGRDGLLGVLKEHLSTENFLYRIVKDAKYKMSLDQLVALRNYAAHDSIQSRARARAVVDQDRIGTAGSWLKTATRFYDIAADLLILSGEIASKARF